MVEFVLFSILGILPFDSFMNTLENCCRMFTFSASSNFVESLSLGLESKGATTLIVFSFRLVWDQNAFGFVLDCCAISRLNDILALRNSLLTLFRAFVYCKHATSTSFRFLATIHDQRFIFFWRIDSLVALSMGILPFSFHECSLDVFSKGTN